jgi:pimeloyl-ACP methyl ester carboxylesterase
MAKKRSMDGTGRLFYRQLPLLARSYRVATYALRDTAPTMDVLVADLARVIDTIAPAEQRAIVIGESFGCALAMSLALANPERVSALVILNSFPHFGPQVRLRLARLGLRAIPWGAMGVIRRLTAFVTLFRFASQQLGYLSGTRCRQGEKIQPRIDFLGNFSRGAGNFRRFRGAPPGPELVPSLLLVTLGTLRCADTSSPWPLPSPARSCGCRCRPPRRRLRRRRLLLQRDELSS